MDEANRPTRTDGQASVPEAPRSRRGFAAMDPEKQREIARKGGRASGGRPENLRGVDRRAAGRKGGQAVVDKYGPQHMAQIGRKGGRSSGGFANMDPERQREIAAKGGRAGGSQASQEPGTGTPSSRSTPTGEQGLSGLGARPDSQGMPHKAEAVGTVAHASASHQTADTDDDLTPQSTS